MCNINAFWTKEEWSSPETLEAGAISGAILETWIIVELLKTWWHHGRRAPFYYYRDKDKKEIDLLIEKDGTLYPLEFKKTASPRRGAIVTVDSQWGELSQPREVYNLLKAGEVRVYDLEQASARVDNVVRYQSSHLGDLSDLKYFSQALDLEIWFKPFNS